MKFFISTNNKVTYKWKTINNILQFGGLIFLLISIYLRRRVTNYSEVNNNEIYFYVSLLFYVFYFILNIIHWLKPNFFEEKAQ